MYNSLYSYFLEKFHSNNQLFELEIPKPNGGSRIFTFPSPDYLFDYHTIVSQFIANIPDNFHQIFESKDYFFPFDSKNNLWKLPQNKDHSIKLTNWISDGYIFILDVDIQDFFPTITPNVLTMQLKSVTNLENLGWICSEKGLVQGPPTSFWLAEYLLIPIDLNLSQNFPNILFIRKLDNYKFYCKSFSDLNNIFEYLKQILLENGFLLNSNKTNIRQIQNEEEKILEIEGRNVLKNKLLKHADNQNILNQIGEKFAIDYLENVCFQRSQIDLLDYQNKETISMILHMLPKNESYFNTLFEKNEDYLWWDLVVYAKKWNISLVNMQDLIKNSDRFQMFKKISMLVIN